MKIQIMVIAILLFATFLNAEEITPSKKIYSKKDILKLSEPYVKNDLKIVNPVVVDVDEDGDFDMLNFTDKGTIEYYKNTATMEAPAFVLENAKYDNYEINSFMPSGIWIPVFFADRDGDNDKDVFGIVNEENNKRDIVYIENTADLDHYTLITIILVLLAVLLIALIVR